MRKRRHYSDFVQEKVFAMHESVLIYIDDMGNEEKFYDMEDMITRCRVVVPDKIYYVITQFVKQYLEVDLYESRDKNGKYGGFDFSKFETKDALDFKEVYEGIAMEYIRPVFVA